MRDINVVSMFIFWLEGPSVVEIFEHSSTSQSMRLLEISSKCLRLKMFNLLGCSFFHHHCIIQDIFLYHIQNKSKNVESFNFTMSSKRRVVS